jgi:PPM family protein phosphatase
VKVVQHAGLTDTGKKRRRNEDAFVVAPPLFGIADGMGGAQAGEVASGLAAAAMQESGANGGGEQRLVELIQDANRRVHERASTDAAASGMGTTMTVALVEPDGRVGFGHVGDSRAYLLRDEKLEQLTDDHSLVAELVRRGELSPAEAEIHPQRSVITRALGTDPDVDVDTFSVEARPGDVFMICSDGLSSYVDGGQLEAIILRYRDDLTSAAKALIQAANRGGGDDNITTVLFRIDEGEPDAATVVTDAPAREHARMLDEEDTLHPEDGIAPPPPAGAAESVPAPVDTMVISSADIQAAMQTQEARAPQAGLGRRMLALLVIVALIVVIVALVWWGLAR